jgi:hypothetical protein
MVTVAALEFDLGARLGLSFTYCADLKISLRARFGKHPE